MNRSDLFANLATITMRDVITCSHGMHPSLLREAIEADLGENNAYLAKVSAEFRSSVIRKSVSARGVHLREALAALDADDLDAFDAAGSLGARVVAFHHAARLVMLPRHVCADIAARDAHACDALAGV